MTASVEAAAASDFQPVCVLLVAANLPTEGLQPHFDTALVARVGNEVAGCVAIECYGNAALLRSLVVTPAHQGVGLGRRLVLAATELARSRHVVALYLLTTTAHEFFARHFGFRPIARDEVPASVQQSVEFRGACPANARVMRSDLPA